MKKEEQKYNLKLTKNQMHVVARALEALERAHMGQFKNSLEQMFELEPDKEYRKNLKDNVWEEYNDLEQIMKSKIFTDKLCIQQNGRYFGITGSGTSESAKISYEINQVIKQFLAVERNDGYWEMYSSYDEPLKLSQEPIPEIPEFKKYKDYPIPKKEWKKLRKLFDEYDFAAMWKIADKYIPKNIVCGKFEIYPFSNKLAPKDANGNYFDDVCLRIWKPKKKLNETY